ncbi:capping protein, Arp2/3 and myosin-I linker protein 2-like [Pelodytes ibericus]
MLLPFSCSPLKPLPFSIKDAEGRGCLFPSTLPACTEHLMDLPTEGEKLQHYTRQRPRPNRTSRQPPRKPHELPSESDSSISTESEVCPKLDEGIDEFFTKKLIQEYHHTPLQVSQEITSLSSTGSRTFKKKIGEFFALRKPRSTKGLKCEKDPEGSPVATKSRKQTLTDILRPLGKSSDAAKDTNKDVTSPEARSAVDPAWTPDAARRIKPRYSREGKSQSLILLSGDDEESLGMKQKRHCEKADGDISNTFEHRVHSMLHRIGVTRVLSSEVKKKQNKDGEIKKAGSEGDIVDTSTESPPPALKARTHSMSTERATPKIAEPIRNPAEEKQIWKDLGKQLNAELKDRCMELHSSPRRSLVILEQIEKKSEDCWSLPGLERCSPAPSPSRIIHLGDKSEAKNTTSEVFGNDENLLKPRLRLKQFQNRRAISAHEEQLRDQGYATELDNVKIPLARLQRSPVLKLKQRIENANVQTNSEIKSDLEAPESENSDPRKRPTPSESPLAMKSEGTATDTASETAQSTAIHQRTEITSSHSPTDHN